MKYLSLKILSLLTLISAVVAIYFRHAEVMTLYAIFKPLTTILIIIIAALIYRAFRTNYSAWIVFALLFSLIGDVFLIGDNYFLYGLAAFFLAHVTFIIAFTRIHGFLRNGKVFAFLALIGTSYFYLLYENLGGGYNSCTNLYERVIGNELASNKFGFCRKNEAFSNACYCFFIFLVF